ncbi:MAG: FAD binding domain-containing protein [bacterium]
MRIKTRLQDLRFEDNVLHIGAAVSLARIAEYTLIEEKFPALAQAAQAIGNPQVRQAGTIGGNLAAGFRGADIPPALLVLDAEIVISGSDVEKLYPIEKLIQERLPAGHLITAIKVSKKANQRSAFRKFTWRRSSGKTIVNVAAALKVQNGRIMESRLAAGGINRARRLPEAERILDGQVVADTVIAEAARTAAQEVIANVSKPPTEKYRRKLIAAGFQQILTEMTSI